ncbi:MAG TPA: glycine/betaine ABC transporter ATP-binding protein [Microscillaceae bacterium]|nr:glycine/betaine ABC transporter ATP-binding protein [Microscillaceae bacterium]
MIEVKQLTKKYGNTRAVYAVSFEVAAQETLVLLGTSGSGKTTTLKMLNRLVEPSSGVIRINGEDVLQQPPELMRRNIGYVIQNIGLFPHYTVAQNVAIVPKLLQWETDKINQVVTNLLERLDIPPAEFAHRKPHELSGGQRQRVGIARALAADPAVLLLDEPFGALDPITRGQIVQEFKNLENLRDKTMVMVTHDVFEAIELGDRILLMDKGEIQQIGTPQDLVFRPENDFVRQFFDSQRFQLELKAVTLGEILIKVRLAEPPPTRKTINFSKNLSLLDTLEQASRYNEKTITIRVVDDQDQQMVQLTRQQLMQAYYQWKQAQ